jgi:hypothetical protein
MANLGDATIFRAKTISDRLEDRPLVTAEAGEQVTATQRSADRIAKILPPDVDPNVLPE